MNSLPSGPTIPAAAPVRRGFHEDIAAIVVGVGGNQWWQGRRIAAAEAAGARFEEALDLTASGKTEEAHKALSAIAAGRRDPRSRGGCNAAKIKSSFERIVASRLLSSTMACV